MNLPQRPGQVLKLFINLASRFAAWAFVFKGQTWSTTRSFPPPRCSGLCATSSSPSRSGCALMLIFLFFRRTLGARDTMSGPAIVALGLGGLPGRLPVRAAARPGHTTGSQAHRLQVVLMLRGVPIAFSIANAALLSIWVKGTIPMVLLGAVFSGGIDSFTLLAVPFFHPGRVDDERGRHHHGASTTLPVLWSGTSREAGTVTSWAARSWRHVGSASADCAATRNAGPGHGAQRLPPALCCSISAAGINHRPHHPAIDRGW